MGYNRIFKALILSHKNTILKDGLIIMKNELN